MYEAVIHRNYSASTSTFFIVFTYCTVQVQQNLASIYSALAKKICLYLQCMEEKKPVCTTT